MLVVVVIVVVVIVACCTCFTMALNKEEKPKSRFLLEQHTRCKADIDTSFGFKHK